MKVIGYATTVVLIVSMIGCSSGRPRIKELPFEVQEQIRLEIFKETQEQIKRDKENGIKFRTWR